MPNRCVVMGCCSYPDNKNYITLFGYPRDPVLKRKWTKAIQSTRANFKEPDTDKKCSSTCVCSEHFSDEEFETPPNLLRELQKAWG